MCGGHGRPSFCSSVCERKEGWVYLLVCVVVWPNVWCPVANGSRWLFSTCSFLFFFIPRLQIKRAGGTMLKARITLENRTVSAFVLLLLPVV